jgi:hypothetical protein
MTLQVAYRKLRRPKPKVLRKTRGRYRYDIWRSTGPKDDDEVCVHALGTFGGFWAAVAVADRATRLTGVSHYACEYDASEETL